MCKYRIKYNKYKIKINNLLILNGGDRNFSITSNSFKNNGSIPKKYACNDKGGENISPHLEWSNVPKNTQSFVIIMRDPTARYVAGKEWIHWIVYNIYANANSLEENNDKYDFGTNSWGKQNYGGMCPPNKEPKEHTYVFEIYALNSKIKIQNPTYEDIQNKIKNLILKKAQISGKFSA